MDIDGRNLTLATAAILKLRNYMSESIELGNGVEFSKSNDASCQI
jgi:hypothetical protein